MVHCPARSAGERSVREKSPSTKFVSAEFPPRRSFRSNARADEGCMNAMQSKIKGNMLLSFIFGWFVIQKRGVGRICCIVRAILFTTFIVTEMLNPKL